LGVFFYDVNASDPIDDVILSASTFIPSLKTISVRNNCQRFSPFLSFEKTSIRTIDCNSFACFQDVDELCKALLKADSFYCLNTLRFSISKTKLLSTTTREVLCDLQEICNQRCVLLDLTG
jgi:hypothetical protein